VTKKTLKIVLVAGARPNFMKIAPLCRSFKKNKLIQSTVIHTGQHYDHGLSEVFLKELGIPKPQINLNVGSGSHACQTSKIMERFEKVIQKRFVDIVLVVGDVNSTMACTLVAKKLGISVAHVEAGLRSFDFTMPEEINRKVTDSIADYCFTPSKDAELNLIREGIPRKKIHPVGNIMIDTLFYEMSKSTRKNPDFRNRSEWKRGQYGVVTIHRPSNVDHLVDLQRIINHLNWISEKVPLVFPIHPRTRSRLKTFGLTKSLSGKVQLLKPLSYFEFLGLVRDAKLVITDSGGIQEETTVLGIPCITLRENTERPITVSEGSNRLVGSNGRKLQKAFREVMKEDKVRIPRIKYWDGKTADRITGILLRHPRMIKK